MLAKPCETARNRSKNGSAGKSKFDVSEFHHFLIARSLSFLHQKNAAKADFSCLWGYSTYTHKQDEWGFAPLRLKERQVSQKFRAVSRSFAVSQILEFYGGPGVVKFQYPAVGAGGL